MNLIQQNISVLHDAKAYLEVISRKAYNQKIELMSGGTLGQHTRHFIEFYQCLQNQACLCEIDYDTRQRNMLIESDPKVALAAIDEIVETFGKLDLSSETVVKSCNSSDYEINSTIG